MISAPPLTQAPAASSFARASRCSSRRATVRCVVTVASAPVGRCTLYEVLGLRAGATGGEIKAAYRRLARELHPDVAGATGDDDFIRLHHAYATLSDADARARYDRDVVANAYAQPPASRPSPHSVWGRPRRTWESDQCW
ncbi:chaperone protein dnaJ 11, chloroplastic-like [Lolium rigidum]|uniref:chaperone protein dnaJ 11, chloroplastic-like n=1 Tax=Lolium rigidum TaxID=89674 RepID=UPI001F5DE9C0|nr:chaperone protein dnaJ 11, chloroplastic-like [Lolium rigidum]